MKYYRISPSLSDLAQIDAIDIGRFPTKDIFVIYEITPEVVFKDEDS